MVNLAERLVYISVISCVSSGCELQRLNYSFGLQCVSKFSLCSQISTFNG